MTKDCEGGALTGLRVIDLTTMVSGPACTQILADLGADVIKVESPQGDETRRMGPPTYRGHIAGHFAGSNRNKRDIALDLNRPEGREILFELLRDADVLVQNFKPGTMEKWGFGYEDVLKDRFPRLVYCQISAFGSDGPLGGLPGYDPVAQAYAGIVSLNGPEGEDPLMLSVSIVDMATALYAAIGIQAALLERTRSNKGQALDITLYDSALTLIHPYGINWLLNKSVPKRMGNRHPAAAPRELFTTRDGQIMLLVINSRQFKSLCDVFKLPLGDDPRFQSALDRVKHADLLAATLAPLFAKEAKEDLAMRLIRAGVPAAPVLEINEALAHPQIAVRDMVIEGPHGFKAVGSPLKLSRTPTRLRRIAPVLGENSREILSEIGLDEATIDALIAGRVVIEEPADNSGAAAR